MAAWLDAVFVIILETPVDDIKKLEDQLAVQDVLADPVSARESWGVTPEQQALGGGLMKG